MAHWIDEKREREIARNKEVYRNRRAKYVTEKTIEYVVKDINNSLIPDCRGEDIDEYGNSRIELEDIRFYNHGKHIILSYHGRMGDYGISDILVIDRRCDLNELISTLRFEFRDWNVKIINDLGDD